MHTKTRRFEHVVRAFIHTYSNKRSIMEVSMRTSTTGATYRTNSGSTRSKTFQCVVQQVFQPKIAPTPIPAALEAVHAGFPSVAQDYFAGDFSFDEHVIQHPDSTFIITVAGDSMQGAGIWDGDLLVVDRSLDPQPGDVVIAILDDELTVKRLLIESGHPVLHAENPDYPDFMPEEAEELTIWGVVMGNFHSQSRATRDSTPMPNVTRPGMHHAQDTRTQACDTAGTISRDNGGSPTGYVQRHDTTTEYHSPKRTDTKQQQQSAANQRSSARTYTFPTSPWDGQ
jgi:DNA polymerase V